GITKSFLAQRSESGFEITALGHAHIDLAWLWPLRETHRKAARTLSTVLRNGELYPEYLFGVSQPQMLDWVKTEHPALYAQLKELYKQRRLELQGGFWVECDTNVPGGESLVRQMIYGKRFFKEEFGYDEEILWIPDVFGYNAQLPQIMKKSGIKYFLTIKLSWNSVNKFPHSTFRWIGLDGSEILTHMPPEGNYNSAARAESLLNTEKKFMERDTDNRAVLLYGIGDGGGGPGMEHLERLRREYDLKGLPKVKQAFAIDFFREIDKDRAKFPEYRGELYLEKHQGTYTTQAKNKYYNRKLECALHEAEIMLTVCLLLNGVKYPKEELEKIWKEVLLYQFHDIIPGSSIKRVYDESCARYKILHGEVISLFAGACGTLSESGGCEAVFNPSPFGFRGFVDTPEGARYAEAPALGFGEFKDFRGESAAATGSTLENELLKVTFTPEGGIASVLGKDDGFEYLRGEGNVIKSYQDTLNAWEVPADYAVNPCERAKLVKREYGVCGGVAEMRLEFAVGESKILQTVRLAPGSRRIDFRTTADWRETHKMLRAAFPLTARNDEARCNIQYGDIRRPTHVRDSFAKAKKEICAHKWIDISDEMHGAALLNDCKYGYRVWDCVLDIDLLRSSMYPGVDADKGTHVFTYSFYPHKDNYVNQLTAEGYFLNTPPVPCGKVRGELCGVPLFDCGAENVAIDWVKPSEDGSGVIVRAYEFAGDAAEAEIKPAPFFKLGAPVLCDLTENELTPAGNKIKFGGYEINTVKFPFKRK
ncbi:MAG: alpha-mannosidase, partial [Clostridia bacterium]|nr:alpha-mannosidase [Clostridia bacterium]